MELRVPKLAQTSLLRTKQVFVSYQRTRDARRESYNARRTYKELLTRLLGFASSHSPSSEE